LVKKFSFLKKNTKDQIIFQDGSTEKNEVETCIFWYSKLVPVRDVDAVAFRQLKKGIPDFLVSFKDAINAPFFLLFGELSFNINLLPLVWFRSVCQNSSFNESNYLGHHTSCFSS
jgi:hypothetical protein